MQEDQGALRSRLELLCDLDDWLKLRNTISGSSGASGVDIVILMFMRRYLKIEFKQGDVAK